MFEGIQFHDLIFIVDDIIIYSAIILIVHLMRYYNRKHTERQTDLVEWLDRIEDINAKSTAQESAIIHLQQQTIQLQASLHSMITEYCSQNRHICLTGNDDCHGCECIYCHNPAKEEKRDEQCTVCQDSSI